MKLDTNQFFDINNLPHEEGILLLGISMSRIGNEQSAEKCYDHLQFLDTKIKRTEGIGVVTLYSDYLYFLSDEPASTLRDRYKNIMFQHKHNLLRLLSKDTAWIKKAFSFYTFGQIMLDNSEVFQSALHKILDIYQKDSVFQEYVDFDCRNNGHGFGTKEKTFVLEEIVSMYLAAKGQLVFNNKFVQETEKWVLQLYPGKPLKSEVYLFQLNPLNLSNPKNKFENSFYDLQNKILYDYSRIDIDTFDFSDTSIHDINLEQEKGNMQHVEVRSIPKKGRGIFAKRDFKKGEVVFEIFGNTIDYATDYTIPLNEKEKVEPRTNKSIVQYMNHSCEPNIHPQKDGRKYLAMRDIQSGEEVVTNYAFFGFEFGQEKTIGGSEQITLDLTCHCGTAHCKGQLTGYNGLTDEEKERYKDFVLPFLTNTP